MVFFADTHGDPSSAGHAFVSFVRLDLVHRQTIVDGVWGFYPVNSTERYASLIYPINGTVVPDMSRQRSEGFAVEVCIAEYASALLVKDKWLHRTYMADFQNCKDYILDVARAIPRIQQPSRWNAILYPTTYIRALKILNRNIDFDGPFVPRVQLEDVGCSDVRLTTGVALLFKGVSTKLSAVEKAVIYQKLRLRLSVDGRSFYQQVDGFRPMTEETFNAVVYPTDLDHDGQEEVFVVYGNYATSGNAGRTIILFIKNNDGDYEANLDFPGLVPDAVTVAGQRYPQLLINGPGFTTPLWRWNGLKYVFYKQLDEADYKKLRKTDIAAISKTYQLFLK